MRDKPSLKDYRQKLEEIGAECQSCGEDISGEGIAHYEHKKGWFVKGFKKKRWLYVICPNCGYQNALWKLGIKRPRGETNGRKS